MRFKIWFHTSADSGHCCHDVEGYERVKAKSWKQVTSYAVEIYGQNLIRIEVTDNFEYPTVERLLEPDEG